MAKNFPTLTEFIRKYPDVHNVRERTILGDIDKIREIFARHDVDLSQEGYDFYASQLVYEAKSSRGQRLETSRKMRKTKIALYELLINKLKSLVEDPLFCKYLNLKHNEVEARLEYVEIKLATFLERNMRAGQTKPIKYWLGYLLPYLHNCELSETKRVNLIYDLLVELNATEIIFQDTDGSIPKNRILESETIQARYGGAPTSDTGEISDFAAKGRIRDWDREIMQAYKNNPSQ